MSSRRQSVDVGNVKLATPVPSNQPVGLFENRNILAEFFSFRLGSFRRLISGPVQGVLPPGQ